MCLKNADLDRIQVNHDCYITHPDRSDDTDDVLLDAANQIDLSKRVLVKWVTSSRSYAFMDAIDNIDDIDVVDFMQELNPIY